MDALMRRLEVLESRAAINDLVSGYGDALDHGETGRLHDMFTEDARFLGRDGIIEGRDAIVAYLGSRPEVVGPTFHYTHDRQIRVVDQRSAEGTIAAHAELVVEGRPFVVALRYHDVYERDRDPGRWRFARRSIETLYAAPVDELAHVLADPHRIRWPERDQAGRRGVARAMG